MLRSMTNALNTPKKKLLSEVSALVDTSDPYGLAMLTTTQKRLKKLEALKFCILLKAQPLSQPKKTKINLESQLSQDFFFIKSSAKSNRFTIELFYKAMP